MWSGVPIFMQPDRLPAYASDGMNGYPPSSRELYVGIPTKLQPNVQNILLEHCANTENTTSTVRRINIRRTEEPVRLPVFLACEPLMSRSVIPRGGPGGPPYDTQIDHFQTHSNQINAYNFLFGINTTTFITSLRVFRFPHHRA